VGLRVGLAAAVLCVLGVGMMRRPAIREAVFTPGGEHEFSVTLTNAAYIDAKLIFTPVGDNTTFGTPDDDNLDRYVTLVDAAPYGGPREIKMHVKFGDYLKPGVYFVDIIAREHNPDAGNMISAVAGVMLRITIRSLSANKTIDILGFSVAQVPEGMRPNASISVISRTTQDIGAVYADFQVYKDGVVAATARSKVVPLATQESLVLIGELPVESFKGGEYVVNATVYYDGMSKDPGTAILKIGTLHVDVTDHSREFQYNTTNRFGFTVANMWNRELQDVYATVLIGDVVKKTASLNIPPFGNNVFEVYFDRDERLLPGSVLANVTVAFKDYDPGTKLYVSKTESFMREIQVVVPPVEEKKELPIMTLLLIGCGVLLLILSIVIVLLIRRRKTDQVARSTPSAVMTAAPAPSTNVKLTASAPTSSTQAAPTNRPPEANKAVVQEPKRQ